MKEIRQALTARYVTAALLAPGAILTIGNWYLNPERGRAWATTLAFLAFLIVPLWMARRLRSRGLSDNWISGGVALAALMLVVGLSGKLAQALGAIDNQDLSRRLTSALVGSAPLPSSPRSCSGCGGCTGKPEGSIATTVNGSPTS